jgi:prepilin-type N-terminal cleavage/methylation domain-containing protein
MPHPTTIRRGFTLIELMAVITLVSLALSAVAVLLNGVFQANRSAENHRALTRSIQRLATQFREDIHSASSVDLEPNEFVAFIAQTQTMAAYQVEGNSIQRSFGSLGQLLQRDTFDLPAGATVTFDDDADGTRSLASLVVTYPLNPNKPELSDRRTLRIEAAIGGTHASRSNAERGNAMP